MHDRVVLCSVVDNKTKRTRQSSESVSARSGRYLFRAAGQIVCVLPRKVGIV